MNFPALLAAILIMLFITAWPGVLTTAKGTADHRAAALLFWAMSARFVSGVGFTPRAAAWRLLFSAPAWLAGIALAAALLLRH
ncbi:MAG TPA: cyd operon YbgE family protein [Aromatoleum sp.]|uniref:cyd operon YbgE family protein n=1 Tax=Aromatoleum sp. TaxID=2307007 RepID=UPI002B45A22D|nr:cyd operon YbgE family protein [Aromatoleum sp.]HJV26182.1 cyd operon YbgE family protein [Aromatoleum sp.]